MACILMVPWPLASHAIVSLKIARTLREAGHDIVYLNIGREDPRFRAHGFASDVVLDDFVPDGLLAEFARRQGRDLYRVLRRRLPEYLSRMQQALDRVVDHHGVRLAVIDRTHAHHAMPLRRRGVSSILLLGCLPLERRPGVPPLTSGSPLPRTPVQHLRNRAEWFVALAGARRLDRRTGMGPALRQLARATGFPEPLLSRGPRGLELRLPQFITCADRFEFLPPIAPYQHFVGPCVDLERQECSFDWAWVAPDTKLAFCSLGTRSGTYPGALAFLTRVVEAFRGLPGWQLVLSAGDLFPGLTPSSPETPANVRIVAEAPQLAMLRRCDVMITHGGMGSIKECLVFGVPMCVFPGADDQPGNAARVAHHRLGAVGHLRHSTARDIRSMVTHVAASALIRARVLDMQQHFLDPAAPARIVGLVGRMLAQRPDHPTGSPSAVVQP